MPIEVVPISINPAGAWMTQAYLASRYGEENLNIFADKDDDEDLGIIATAIQQAIDDSEDEVSRILAYRYAVPLTGLSDGDITTLRRLTGPVTMYWLYAGRGNREAANPYTIERDDALAQLRSAVRPPVAIQTPTSLLSIAATATWQGTYGDAEAITTDLNDNTINAYTLRQTETACAIYGWGWY